SARLARQGVRPPPAPMAGSGGRSSNHRTFGLGRLRLNPPRRGLLDAPHEAGHDNREVARRQGAIAGCLFYAAGVRDRPGIALEARAQIGDLSLVAHEVGVALLEAIVRERRQSGGRRYVAAGRVDSRAALPVLGKIPGHEKLGSIWMRRILEDRLRGEGYREIIVAGPCQRNFSTAALDLESAARGGIEARRAFARCKAARPSQMSLHEFGLLLHVLGHVAPAIFLNDGSES